MSVLDGEWSDWSDWENCYLDCGSGNQTHTRTCTHPEPQFNCTECGADESETKVCNNQPCQLGLFVLSSLFLTII